MKFFIPSYKRAKNCITAKAIKEAIICVDEKEYNEYKKYNNNKIIKIPHDINGKGMAVIRNFILDQAKENEEIVMLDDDIKKICFFEKAKHNKVTEKEFYNFCENAFRITRELGTILWGVNLQSDKLFYREYSPFSFSSIVLAPIFAIIKDNEIVFDTKLGLKEDYDYSLQVLNKYRKILRFNKYHYHMTHITNEGGCASYRTKNKEKQNMDNFIKKMGIYNNKTRHENAQREYIVEPDNKITNKGYIMYAN